VEGLAIRTYIIVSALIIGRVGVGSAQIPDGVESR
jgi:hypothetical protein